MPKAQAWIAAARPRTLPLALSCIGMGSFLAASRDKFDGLIFLFCCLTTVLLQVLSNLANDYGDSVHGADHAGRSGPARAVQSGAISMSAMRRAVALFVGLTLLSGITLLLIAFGWELRSLLYFFSLGVLCILAAIAYTVGRRPYGYIGLGDLSVLIFFGFVGVMGSLYLFTSTVAGSDVLPALSCGLFSMAVLNVNNIRDIDADRQAGKFSLPVRMGRAAAVKYHWGLLIGGMTCSVAFVALNFRSPWQLLFLLTVPFFFRNGMAVSNLPSDKLDPYLRQLALSTLSFVLAFGIGILI
jgi:1,4-dihydroxy-2-naphthoate octaprenyltransferase